MKYLTVLLLLLALPTPAIACSPVKGYRTPTNFELVQRAELIVLARIISGPDAISPMHPDINIETVKVLKGTLPDDPLHLMGAMAWNGRSVQSMPTPLGTSHFSTGMGACVRMFYPKGGLVLAMFQKTPPELRKDVPDTMMPMFLPFARVAEDVEGDDAIWVRAVQTYLAIQQSANSQNLRILVDQKRVELLTQTDDVAAQAMAEDLAYYLDMAGTGKSRSNGDAHWILFDSLDEAGALVGRAQGSAKILRCRRGGDGVELYWPGDTGGKMALHLGDQIFPATPTNSVLSPGMKTTSGLLPYDVRLRSALMSVTETSGVSMQDQVTDAKPLDILRQFALRCDAFMAPHASK